MRTRKLVLLTVVCVLAVTAALMGTGVSGASSAQLSARLSGEEEVPGPGDEDGRGRASIRLGEDEVCFGLSWENIASPTMAHIHVGAAGVAGPVVVGLFVDDDPLPDTIDRVGGCAPADPAVIDAIEADPSGYYVNIHNVDFPAGAIRGQLH